MKFVSLTIFGLLASLVHSNPTPKGTKFLATFDDIHNCSSVIPELEPIPNPYRNLAFPGFDCYGNATSVFTFPSANQTAATFIGEEILLGKRSGINITSAAPAEKYFDLKSLYLACVITSQTALDPEDCTIILSGTKKVGGEVVTHDCSYSVKTNGKEFAFCEIPSSFEGLVGVAVIFKGLGEQLATATFFDNVAGVIYQ